MTRSALLAALAFGVVTTASAQTEPAEMPTDMPVMADTVAVDSTEATVELDPERARALYDEGVTSLRAQDYDAALLKFEEALLYNPSYAAAGLGRAQSLAAQRRLDDARTAFEEAIAMANASDASNAGDVRSTAQRQLAQVTAAIEQRDASAAAAEQANAAAAGAQATAAKVEEATQMLAGNEITMAQATDAYALLEQARMDGYDADLVAFYYAKALNAMERGADAVPYAQTAVDAADPSADNSALYIQLGLAHMNAGNADQARTAFESITDGQAWHGWAQHYIGQLDSEG
ncbi:tetratricopeptide repeat protein [Rubrivirga sp.]|uniref:tetratricopeptide repeat protein n=1 Tax=Rubrivirga sp. TaxID=1885344 RepID=UPI003B523610